VSEYDATAPAATLNEAGSAAYSEAARRLGAPIRPQSDLLPADATDEHYATLERRMRRFGSQGINAFLEPQRADIIAGAIAKQVAARRGQK
jgi:hypothetical protein